MIDYCHRIKIMSLEKLGNLGLLKRIIQLGLDSTVPVLWTYTLLSTLAQIKV